MNFEAFKGAPWFNTDYDVTIGGLGNIGSWTALVLSRLGYRLYLYDFDTVEHRNVSSQLYSPSDVGQLKTVATRNRIIDISGNQHVQTFERYGEHSMSTNIMISAFDNMEARKIMFDNWLSYQKSKTERPEREVNIFIDGRSLAEGGQVFAIRGMAEAKKYQEEYLFSDEEAQEGVCSYKSTSHSGTLISSIISSVLVNHISNRMQGFGRTTPGARHIPFKTEYQLPLFMFELEK